MCSRDSQAILRMPLQRLSRVCKLEMVLVEQLILFIRPGFASARYQCRLSEDDVLFPRRSPCLWDICSVPD
jgi:hypothetical protein